MIKSSYKVIGVMSGTSLDGVDLACVHFSVSKNWRFDIEHSETIPYTEEWLAVLKNLVLKNHNDLEEIDVAYTQYLSEIIIGFMERNNIDNVDAISSHGHTALHDSDNGITYQIGNLKQIATLVQCKVVCDFRVDDVKLGGQGAPLVPIGDVLLFPEYDYCVNLGGFANISTDINNERIAYDICPVNIVLNYYMSQIGMDYDDKGEMAASGNVHANLLQALNSLDYYTLKYPKSLGYEWVENFILPLIKSFQLEINDILRTFIAHIASQISKEINTKENAQVLITGGGVYNDFLINEIKKQTKNTLVIPEANLIEYKEALIFGLLGILKIRNEINCLSSVTGANRNHSSGKIYLP